MVTIKEAELLTGITRQNIRYYEKMGLIYPSREKENQYRIIYDIFVFCGLIFARKIIDKPMFSDYNGIKLNTKNMVFSQKWTSLL